MPVAQADMQVVYSRLEKRIFNKRTVAVGLCNTRHQGELDAGNLTVKIPARDIDVNITDYVDGADWKTATDDVGIDYQDWTPPRKRQARVKINWEEANLVPLDLVQSAAEEYGRAHAEETDDYILNDVIRANVVSARTQKLGTGANYIKPDGDAEGTGANLVWTALRRIRLLAANANVATPVADSPSELWAVMKPYMWDALEEFLRASGNADSIAYEVIRNGMVARLMGMFDIIQSNTLEQETVGGKAHGIVLAGTNVATTYATRAGTNQVFNPDNNPFGPYWLLNRLRRYGAVIENDVPLFKIQVQAEA